MAPAHPISAFNLRQLLRYDPATGVLTRLIRTSSNVQIGDVAGSFHKDTGYIHVSLCGRKYLAHRLAWVWMTGEWPLHQVDHWNRIRHDNRWANLRAATNGQNQQNAKRKSHNKSGHKGVMWDERRKLWRAYIGVNGNNQHIGYFKTKDEAVAARIERAAANHGVFVRW